MANDVKAINTAIKYQSSSAIHTVKDAARVLLIDYKALNMGYRMEWHFLTKTMSHFVGKSPRYWC